MTYNVFGGTLNPAQSNHISALTLTGVWQALKSNSTNRQRFFSRKVEQGDLRGTG